MRKIIFRAKRSDANEWVYGDLIHGVGLKHGFVYILPITHIYPKGCNELDGWNVLPKTVGQLICTIPNTSMYVDNSQDIYEGDIFTTKGSNTKYVAQYGGYGEYYGISNEGDKYGAYILRFTGQNIKNKGIEIIGNITDNPELLTSKY